MLLNEYYLNYKIFNASQSLQCMAHGKLRTSHFCDIEICWLKAYILDREYMHSPLHHFDLFHSSFHPREFQSTHYHSEHNDYIYRLLSHQILYSLTKCIPCLYTKHKWLTNHTFTACKFSSSMHVSRTIRKTGGWHVARWKIQNYSTFYMFTKWRHRFF